MRLPVLVVAVLAACKPVAADPDVAVVERGRLAITVDVSGTMRAVDSSRVGPPSIAGVWNYTIAMMAPEGSLVQPGEPILVFDTTTLKRRLDEKIAERDSAATQLQMKLASAKLARQDEDLAIAEAKAELRKAALKADAPADITAVVELEKAKLDLKLAREKVAYLQRKSKSARQADEGEIKRWRSKRDRAEGRVEEITAAVEQMTIKSPRAGTVIYETDWEGHKKKVGDTAWRGQTLLQLVSLEEMEGNGEVDEVDIAKIDVGEPVSVRLDAQADVELRGTLETIRDTVQRASPDNPLKVAKVVIALEQTQGVKLRPGMRFRGQIETDHVDDALLVPLEAIVSTPDGPVAHRRAAVGTEPVELELGRRNATHVEVLQGLSEGDELVILQEVAP
jgi:multidrug efflux pump subunit AcrA (membrane-fusion protein)